MRRAVARGRIFPQSFSTDRRYGRLSLKAVALFPLMWANADDQGRLCGDPEEVKYTCCPNIDHLAKADIPNLLKELAQNRLIALYDTPKNPAIQLLDWWDIQRPQWAYPSEYPPPKGWNDRLRYHSSPTEIITENWETPAQRVLPSALRSTSESQPVMTQTPVGRTLGSALPSNTALESNKDLNKHNNKNKNKEEEEEGRSRSKLRSKPTPAPYHLSLGENRVYELLNENYRMRWGEVRPEKPTVVIPRETGARERAQLRDLAIELCAAGGGGLSCEDHVIKEAFDEAAKQQKFYVSYVRRILFDWLHIEEIPKRNRSP